MEDRLISEETVKLANEKGFNEYTSRMKSLYVILEDLWEQDHHNGNDFLMYVTDDIITSEEPPSHPGIKYKVIGKRPTQSILQKWLRDVHNIHISLTRVYKLNNNVPSFSGYCIYIGDGEFESKIPINTFFNLNYYPTYEEALEVGLIESLKLINL
jgi:hypothetical protein